MLPVLAEIVDLPTYPVPDDGGMSWPTLLTGGGVGGVFVAGVIGFWRWMIARVGNDAKRIDHRADQDGRALQWLLESHQAMRKEIEDLRTKLNALEHRESQLRRAYRALALLSLREINRLRALLKQPPLDRWPPTRPEAPSSPAPVSA